MLEQTPTHEFQAVKGVYESLAYSRVVGKGSYAELGRRDREVEHGPVLCGERDGDGGGEGGDAVACDAVGARLCGVGNNVGGNERVDRLIK